MEKYFQDLLYKENSYYSSNNTYENIIFICNAKYFKYLLVLIEQIIGKSGKNFNFIIMHEDFGKKHKNMLKKISIKKGGVFFSCVNVSNSKSIDKLTDGRSKIWFSDITKKILIFSSYFSNLKKILYLDIDLSIIGDIKEIFFENHWINMVLENASITYNGLNWKIPKDLKENTKYKNILYFKDYLNSLNIKKYYNAGVIFINNNFRVDFNDKYNACDFIFNDQDWINVVFKKVINMIDFKWNMSASYLYEKNKLLFTDNFVNEDFFNRFSQSTFNIKIVHYLGYKKPWEWKNSDWKPWDKWYWKCSLLSKYKFYFLFFFCLRLIYVYLSKIYLKLKGK